MNKQQTEVKNFLMKAYYLDERINSSVGSSWRLRKCIIRSRWVKVARTIGTT